MYDIENTTAVFFTQFEPSKLLLKERFLLYELETDVPTHAIFANEIFQRFCEFNQQKRISHKLLHDAIATVFFDPPLARTF